MKARLPASTVVVWRLAELEARRAQAIHIEPSHLLLALCRIIDLDLVALVPKDLPNRHDVLEEVLREVRRLRDVFCAAALDAGKFRRRLRQSIPAGNFVVASAEPLHRSDAAKEVFADAERYAELSGGSVLPVHLLFAVLLTKEAQRDVLLAEFDVDKSKLERIVRVALLSNGRPAQNSSDEMKRRLN